LQRQRNAGAVDLREVAGCSLTSVQDFWYGLGFPGCSTLRCYGILFSQPKDKVIWCRLSREHAGGFAGGTAGLGWLGNGGKFYVD